MNDNTPQGDESSRHRSAPDAGKRGNGAAEDSAESGNAKPGKRDGVGDHLDIYA